MTILPYSKRFFGDRVSVAAIAVFVLVLFMILSNMLRMPPWLYYTPIYLSFLFLLLNKQIFYSAKKLASISPFFILYIAYCIASIFFSRYPSEAASSVRQDLLVPVLALITSVGVITYSKNIIFQDRVGLFSLLFMFFLSALFIFFYRVEQGLLVSEIMLFYKTKAIPFVFDTIGYYSSYAIIFSAAAIPYLAGKGRYWFYVLCVSLLLLSQQRVAWLFFPIIAITDLVVSSKNPIGKKHIFLLFVVLVLGSIGLKYKINQYPVDAFDPSVRAEGVMDALFKNERVHAWQEWLGRTKETWIVGTGYGRETALKTFSEKEAWSESKLYHAHNIVLNTYIQLGIVGLAIFLVSQIQILRWAWKNWSLKSSQAVFLLDVFFLIRNQFDDFSFKRVLIVYAITVGYFIGVTLLSIDKQSSPDTVTTP